MHASDTLIESRDVVIDGVDCVVSIDVDTDVRPDEFDCYTTEQIEAWKMNDWTFVGVTVKCDQGSANLWGIEFGLMPGFPDITLDRLISDPYMICDGISRTLPQTLLQEIMS